MGGPIITWEIFVCLQDPYFPNNHIGPEKRAANTVRIGEAVTRYGGGRDRPRLRRGIDLKKSFDLAILDGEDDRNLLLPTFVVGC